MGSPDRISSTARYCRATSAVARVLQSGHPFGACPKVLQAPGQGRAGGRGSGLATSSAQRRDASAVAGLRSCIYLEVDGVHSWTFRKMERMLGFLDLGTMASEDRCRDGGHSSGRLSEAP